MEQWRDVGARLRRIRVAHRLMWKRRDGHPLRGALRRGASDPLSVITSGKCISGSRRRAGEAGGASQLPASCGKTLRDGDGNERRAGRAARWEAIRSEAASTWRQTDELHPVLMDCRHSRAAFRSLPDEIGSLSSHDDSRCKLVAGGIDSRRQRITIAFRFLSRRNYRGAMARASNRSPPLLPNVIASE